MKLANILDAIHLSDSAHHVGLSPAQVPQAPSLLEGPEKEHVSADQKYLCCGPLDGEGKGEGDELEEDENKWQIAAVQSHIHRRIEFVQPCVKKEIHQSCFCKESLAEKNAKMSSTFIALQSVDRSLLKLWKTLNMLWRIRARA